MVAERLNFVITDDVCAFRHSDTCTVWRICVIWRYEYVFVCMCCVCLFLCVYVCVCVFKFRFHHKMACLVETFAYVCMYVCMHVCICINAHRRVPIYVCVCVCVYQDAYQENMIRVHIRKYTCARTIYKIRAGLNSRAFMCVTAYIHDIHRHLSYMRRQSLCITSKVRAKSKSRCIHVCKSIHTRHTCIYSVHA